MEHPSLIKVIVSFAKKGGIRMWIARDKDGELVMCEQEPIYENGSWSAIPGLCYSFGYNYSLFDFISPGMKVELSMKKEETSPDTMKDISKSLKELNQIFKRIEKKIK